MRPHEKPPLGIMPEWVWREHRVLQLCAVIERRLHCRKSPRDQALLNGYAAELQRHIDFLCELPSCDAKATDIPEHIFDSLRGRP